MTDIGDVPLTLLLATFFAAHFLRGPVWIRMTSALGAGLFGVWALAFGLHIPVPSSVGKPLWIFAGVSLLLSLLAAAVRRPSTEANASR